MRMIRVGESVIRERIVRAVGVVSILFGVVGCSVSVSTAPTQTATSDASSTPSPASTSSIVVAGPKLIRVPGYTYTAPPAELKQMADVLEATGMVTSVVGRGVQDGSGAEVGAIILAQYNSKLTAILDESPSSQILDGAAKQVQGEAVGKTTVTAHVLSGNQVRLIQGAEAAVVIAYRHGGVLIEVTGAAPTAVLRFTGAYLAANANT